ncbi:hypothetical protein QLQ12_42255 [Actinoplanes sp. NEAU-A12]|uniref:Uncharacterized protein n=1 Tax=Actinoplanes sandaracinus TaxID=3045177 RepID=A0ABT6WZP0_9ACTN|nr:hypothetical protein [Actinoplanes sandaracinus]MDI6105227.1 hypothetical protein [Actinoplanes sandaracinus]
MRVPPLQRWGDVVIGAAVRTAEGAGDALAGLRTAGLRARLTGLAERGAAERSRMFDIAITTLATSAMVERVVEIQLDRVLELLEREPDRIRALVRGQRDTMVGEAIGRVRTGAAAGDAAVDRLTLRWPGRGGAPENLP